MAKIIDDVSKNADKKGLDIKCGCCLIKGNPRDFEDEKGMHGQVNSTASN